MKKTFLLLITGVLITSMSPLKAQELTPLKNEIKLGYGTITLPEMSMPFVLMFAGIGYAIDRDTLDDFSTSFYGDLNFSYERDIKKWLGVGVTATFNPINVNMTSEKKNDFSFTWYVTTLMPDINFYYLRKPMVSLYSGVAAGVTVIFEKDYGINGTSTTETDYTFAYQVNMIGVRVGKQIAGFAEFGFGLKGLMNIGISAKL